MFQYDEQYRECSQNLDVVNLVVVHSQFFLITRSLLNFDTNDHMRASFACGTGNDHRYGAARVLARVVRGL